MKKWRYRRFVLDWFTGEVRMWELVIEATTAGKAYELGEQQTQKEVDQHIADEGWVCYNGNDLVSEVRGG